MKDTCSEKKTYKNKEETHTEYKLVNKSTLALTNFLLIKI